jgi:hypothetical protein
MAWVIVFCGSAPQRQSALAAEPMLAGDVKTWSKLFSEKDFDEVVKHLTKEIKSFTDVDSPALFNRNVRKLERTGYMVAIVGNVEASKGGENAAKAAALREAGLTLAATAKKKDFAKAKEVAETIAAYPDKIKPHADAKPTEWTKVAPLDTLMKAVSQIDTTVRNCARKTGKDFTKLAGTGSNEARLLACIAVVSREHKDESDWKTWCDDLREGAVLLAGNFAKKNPAGSKKAYDNLQKTCNTCHEKYRDTAE